MNYLVLLRVIIFFILIFVDVTQLQEVVVVKKKVLDNSCEEINFCLIKKKKRIFMSRFPFE